MGSQGARPTQGDPRRSSAAPSRPPRARRWTQDHYLQPLDAIAHAGLESQGEEQRLADLRPRPHRRAAGAPGGRTQQEQRRSPVPPLARPPPLVLRARRLQSGRAGRRVKAAHWRAGGVLFKLQRRGRPGEASSARAPPACAAQTCGAWLELSAVEGETGTDTQTLTDGRKGEEQGVPAPRPGIRVLIPAILLAILALAILLPRWALVYPFCKMGKLG